MQPRNEVLHLPEAMEPASVPEVRQREGNGKEELSTWTLNKRIDLLKVLQLPEIFYGRGIKVAIYLAKCTLL